MPPLGTPSPAAEGGQLTPIRSAPQPNKQWRPSGGQARRRGAKETFPLGIIVAVGVALFLMVIVGIMRRMSSLKEDVSQSQSALIGAERLAQQALKRAEQTDRNAEREIRALERQQRATLQKATSAANKDARKALVDARKRKIEEARLAAARAAQAVRKEQAALASSKAKTQAKSNAKTNVKSKSAARRKQAAPARKSTASRSVASGPPAPGWPTNVLSTGGQLRANAFKVVSVVGIRVGRLPSAGCSPCQAQGTLSDGTPVILVAPSFTPFVPAKMAGASRVAVKALARLKDQCVHSGSSRSSGLELGYL